MTPDLSQALLRDRGFPALTCHGPAHPQRSVTFSFSPGCGASPVSFAFT